MPSGEGDTVGFAKVAILFSKNDMKFRFLAACAFFETTSLRLRTVVVCNKKSPNASRKCIRGCLSLDDRAFSRLELSNSRCDLNPPAFGLSKTSDCFCAVNQMARAMALRYLACAAWKALVAFAFASSSVALAMAS